VAKGPVCVGAVAVSSYEAAREVHVSRCCVVCRRPTLAPPIPDPVQVESTPDHERKALFHS